MILICSQHSYRHGVRAKNPAPCGVCVPPLWRNEFMPDNRLPREDLGGASVLHPDAQDLLRRDAGLTRPRRPHGQPGQRSGRRACSHGREHDK